MPSKRVFNVHPSKFPLFCPENLDEPKKSDYLFNVLSNVIMEWKLNDHVVNITNDSGANIAFAVQGLKAEIIKLPCVNHRLNSTVNDLFKIASVKSKRIKRSIQFELFVKDLDENGKFTDYIIYR